MQNPRDDTPESPLHGMHPIEFIHAVRFEQLPSSVISQARRCLLDLCGVAAAGTSTRLSGIIRDHAAAQMCAASGGARMLFDGRRVSLAGAALAGATTIDSLDAHDGHVLTKGHVGVTILPTLLALADSGLITEDREFLTSLVLGYEIATRAGVALHASACDYHTSGAWNALGATALVARALRLSAPTTREALGIAEYYGPRSQMMRCIDHPTMVKDGSGWGAMTGVCAALLASSGHTGAPAITMEADGVAAHWDDLGVRWAILEQYFKPYPVCRWAQPAVEAALSISRKQTLHPDDIAEITVTTFHEACRLATRHPTTTEQAQYSLPFAVAMALVRGQLGASEITGTALDDTLVRRLTSGMILQEKTQYNERFPAERWAEVVIRLHDGRLLQSAPHTARGDAEAPLDDQEIDTKFKRLAHPVLGVPRSMRLQECIRLLGRGRPQLPDVLSIVLAPSGTTGEGTGQPAER